MRKIRTMIKRQSHSYPTFWQRLILVGALLISGEVLAYIIPIQAVRAEATCAGNGGPGGYAVGGQNGADGGVGGDCMFGGNKSFAPGGFNQNNGYQGVNTPRSVRYAGGAP